MDWARGRGRARSAIATVIALALLAAACGGDSDNESSAPSAETTVVTSSAGSDGSAGEASDSDLDAEVVFAYAAQPTSLDPHRNTQTGPGDNYLMPVYDRLIMLDDEGVLEPMLAESWEFSEDATAFTLTLRDDITFQDGSPIDAAAVKANIDRARTLPDSAHLTNLAPVEEVEVVDERTVTLRLTPGEGASIPTVLGGNAGMIINPKAFEDPAADLTAGPGAGNGSGVFEVVSAELGGGGQVVYQRRSDIDQYWDDRAGKIARLTWINIPTSTQRINAVQAGDITMGQVTGVDVNTAKNLIESGQGEGWVGNQPTIPQVLRLRATRPPLDDVRVRQAIRHAINKEAMTQGLFSGLCTVMNGDYPLGRHWAASEELESIDSYDPDRARELLAESGNPNPSFTIVAAPTWMDAAQAVQQLLLDVGIQAQLEPAPTTAGGPTFRNGDFDAESGAFVVSPDPSILMANLYMDGMDLIPDADKPRYQPFFDQLRDPANDDAARAEIWAEVAQMLWDDAYAINYCYNSQAWFHDGSIANLDDLVGETYGLIDVRYLYIKQS